MVYDFSDASVTEHGGGLLRFVLNPNITEPSIERNVIVMHVDQARRLSSALLTAIGNYNNSHEGA